MPDLVTTKPMRSQAQWRFLFGTGKPFAKRWARATPGGKGTRYQKLPIKVKAPNYGARAGQTIGGRLVRGNDGKFASGGGAAPAAKPKRKPKVKPVKPKVTPEQRAAAREQERIARRDAVLAQLGIDPGASEALVMLSNGEQPDPAALARMGASEAGLVEQAADGSYRMTPAGRQMLNAAERGDKGLAGDVISRARDRIAAAAEKPVKPVAAGGGGGGKKKPEKPPKLPARQTSQAPKPVSGGGGAAKPPAEKPEAQPTTDPALAALAQRLSAGEELSQDEQDALIRNGLARMVRGALVLTMAGQRATRTKAIAPTRTTDAGHTGVMVAFYPDQAAAKAIAGADGVTEPVEQLHLTLCFLGDSTEQPLATNKDRLIDAIAQWATEKGQALKGVVNGLGRFFHSESDGTNAVYVAPDVPGLPELRQSMAEWIEASGFDYSQDHGFTPHITVAYVPEDAPTPPIRVETPISFDRVTLAWGDEQYDFAMGISTKSFHVYKDARGKLRWVAYSSNAYRDRDEEIVSTKALTDDCARADAAKAYGPLRWWHVPGWELGDCDFNAMHGRVLVESGTFKSDSIGRAVAAKAADLQLSIGFTHAPDEPDRSGVFHHIQRFERSLVPSGRAANPFTRLIVKETRMDTEKETALKGVLGEEVATQVIAGAEAVQKDADDRQTAFKSANDPWAAVLTTLKAAVATMVAPPAPEPVVEKAIEDIPAEPEAKAEDMMVEETVVEPVAEDPGEMTYDEFVQAIRAVVREELAAELKAQIAPLAGMLDIEKKVSGAVQSLMQPYQAQKDASDAERADEIATLKAKIAELEGDQPAAWRAPWGGYRASADDATIATKEQVDGLDLPPLDADPEWTKIQKHLIGNGHLTS